MQRELCISSCMGVEDCSVRTINAVAHTEFLFDIAEIVKRRKRLRG